MLGWLKSKDPVKIVKDFTNAAVQKRPLRLPSAILSLYTVFLIKKSNKMEQ